MAAEVGLDLMSLKYTDADPKRKEWLVENGAAQPAKKVKPQTKPLLPKPLLPSSVPRPASPEH
jgi:hypothetical protein